MSPQVRIEMTNYPRVKEVLSRVASERTYRGAFRDTITAMLDIAKNYAMSITHIYTGMLRMSHVVEYDGHRMRGVLKVDEQALARQYGGRLKVPMQFVAEYAIYEHARGGSHAFYERTLRETGGILQMRGMRTLVEDIDREISKGDLFYAITG